MSTDQQQRLLEHRLNTNETSLVAIAKNVDGRRKQGNENKVHTAENDSINCTVTVPGIIVVANVVAVTLTSDSSDVNMRQLSRPNRFQFPKMSCLNGCTI